MEESCRYPRCRLDPRSGTLPECLSLEQGRRGSMQGEEPSHHFLPPLQKPCFCGCVLRSKATLHDRTPSRPPTCPCLVPPKFPQFNFPREPLTPCDSPLPVQSSYKLTITRSWRTDVTSDTALEPETLRHLAWASLPAIQTPHRLSLSSATQAPSAVPDSLMVLPRRRSRPKRSTKHPPFRFGL